jgi:hypothetical protein
VPKSYWQASAAKRTERGLGNLVVADTGAIVALLDRDDAHHAELRELHNQSPGIWVLPWAILPEVDYLVLRHLGADVERTFLADIAAGAFNVHFGDAHDLSRAHDLNAQYASFELGLTDATVMAVAERLRAGTIATLDVRDFGAVTLATQPRLVPRDLPSRGAPMGVSRAKPRLGT